MPPVVSTWQNDFTTESTEHTESGFEKRKSPCSPCAPWCNRFGSEAQFEVEGAGDGVVAVGRDFAEAELPVEGDGGLHEGGNRVEADGAVAEGAGLGQGGLGEGTAEAAAAEGGADVEALHLCRGPVPLVQPHAASRIAVLDREQQAPARRGVHPGQGAQLLVESLEAEGEPERPGVLQEQGAHLLELRSGSGDRRNHFIRSMCPGRGRRRREVRSAMPPLKDASRAGPPSETSTTSTSRPADCTRSGRRMPAAGMSGLSVRQAICNSATPRNTQVSSSTARSATAILRRTRSGEKTTAASSASEITGGRDHPLQR